MRIVKTVKPGCEGSNELLPRYGPRVLCARSRYDEATWECPKTVELVV